MTGSQIFGLATSVWGCVIIYGTHKRWRYFVDPPEGFWWRFPGGGVGLLKSWPGVVVNLYLIGAGLVVGGIVILFFR